MKIILEQEYGGNSEQGRSWGNWRDCKNIWNAEQSAYKSSTIKGSGKVQKIKAVMDLYRQKTGHCH